MLKINVEPDSVKTLLTESRQIPNERIEDLKSKIDELDGTLATWKGNASTSHKEALTTLQETLENSQLLMTEILNTIDHSMDEFTKIDHDISANFHANLDFHQNK